MALFKILKGVQESLPTTYHEGYCYFCTDTQLFFIDTTDTVEGRLILNAGDALTLTGATFIKGEGEDETASQIPSMEYVGLIELNKMDKENPTGTGSFSLNRQADTTIGECSFAEGYNTTASGDYSHAEGYYSIAQGQSQHVQGEYNILDIDESSRGKYAHIVGNGTDSIRSNAHTLDWEGNAWFAGDVYTNSTSGTNKDDGSKKLATEEYADTKATIQFIVWEETD